MNDQNTQQTGQRTPLDKVFDDQGNQVVDIEDSGTLNYSFSNHGSNPVAKNVPIEVRTEKLEHAKRNVRKVFHRILDKYQAHGRHTMFERHLFEDLTEMSLGLMTRAVDYELRSISSDGQCLYGPYGVASNVIFHLDVLDTHPDRVGQVKGQVVHVTVSNLIGEAAVNEFPTKALKVDDIEMLNIGRNLDPESFFIPEIHNLIGHWRYLMPDHEVYFWYAQETNMVRLCFLNKELLHCAMLGVYPFSILNKHLQGQVHDLHFYMPVDAEGKVRRAD